MLSNLKRNKEIVSMEAFSISTVGNLVQKVIPNMISEFKGFLSGFNHQNLPVVDFKSSAFDKLVKELPNHKYTDLVPLLVYVPEGLNISYSDYINNLNTSVELIEQLIPVMNDYSIFLSRLITNKEDQMSALHIKDKQEVLQSELEHANDSIKKNFNSTQNTEVKLNKVVGNNSEWTIVFTNLETLNKRLLNIKPSNVQKKVAELDELLTILLNKFNRNELDNISSEMISNLSEYTFTIAKTLEFYSVTVYRLQALTNAVNETVAKLNKQLDI